ncbi:hypothetical protein M3Y99_00962100 [Aphelenchoides fujianensis]|nr:hypothetical protein M3Y99_00962100 [Aphelenchoides fujianensis]
MEADDRFKLLIASIMSRGEHRNSVHLNLRRYPPNKLQMLGKGDNQSDSVLSSRASSPDAVPTTFEAEEELEPEEVPRDPPTFESNSVLLLPHSEVVEAKNAPTQTTSTTFQIDTTLHTLRKGWLMIRGKTNSQWTKQWVVLCGLELKLYSDWMDEQAEPSLLIDLSEAEKIVPCAVARGYGLEIRCRRSRIVLSALTPGIRDSWMAALEQNLNNPSPTSECPAPSMDNLSQTDSADILSITRRNRKHIAYVAPESHHSTSLLDGFSSTEADDDDARTGDSSVRPTRDVPDAEGVRHLAQMAADNVSLSSADDSPPPRILPPLGASNSAVDFRPAGGGMRQLSVSPTSMRRSPVNRLKERQARRAAVETSSSSPNHLRRVRLPLLARQQRAEVTNNGARGSNIEVQVNDLRNQLNETRSRLGEVECENDRLRALVNQQDLTHLRRCLTIAEADVIKQQDVPQDFELMEAAFNEVIAAYEKLSSLLEARANGSDNATNTDPVLIESENAKNELVREIRDLEAEIEDIQHSHSREMDDQRSDFERQLRTLRERIEVEEGAKQRLQEELQNVNRVGSSQEQDFAALKQTYEAAIDELRQQFEEELEKMRAEHDQELEDEKQATKLALDAVQRTHAEELQRLREAQTASKGDSCRCQAEKRLLSPVRRIQSPRQKEVMEVMNVELSNLSALYSAKCLENKTIMAEKEEHKQQLESENARLQRDLAEKETLYSQLKRRLNYLEQKLKNEAVENVVEAPAPPPRQSAAAVDPAVRFRPNGAASRKTAPNRRRHDVRYHSNPSIPVLSDPAVHEPFDGGYDSDHRRISADLAANSLAVSERRKFFERAVEFSGRPF